MTTTGTYLALFRLINHFVSDVDFELDGISYGIAFIDAFGLLVCFAGGVVTLVAGVMLRVDRKLRAEKKERLEHERRYHDTYRAVAEYMAQRGYVSGDHMGTLEVIAAEFRLDEETVAKLNSEAGLRGARGRVEEGDDVGWRGSGPADGARGDPCPDCDEPLVYVEEYGDWYCRSCDTYPFVEGPREPAPFDRGEKRKKGGRWRGKGKGKGKGRGNGGKGKRPRDEDDGWDDDSGAERISGSRSKRRGRGRDESAPSSCPECDGPLEFVEDYGQWYCEECDRYPFVEK
jgi:ribosomal protein L37AE/L43A